MGVERKSVAMSEQERVTCAYHEAGHAVVAALLPDADPLHKVTIIPRGRALGVTMQLPEADRYTHSKPFIEAQIAILMGGRVAEELFLRQMTSGASNDIERATELARKMVCELGMSPLGPLHFRRPSSAWESDSRAAGFSEETARRVDDEIRALVMRGYETARQIVERQRAAVEALAEELLDVESVDADRLKQTSRRLSRRRARSPAHTPPTIGFSGGRLGPHGLRRGRIAGVRQRPLEQRGLRRDELQLQHQARQQIELRDRECQPHRQPGAAGAGRDERPHRDRPPETPARSARRGRRRGPGCRPRKPSAADSAPSALRRSSTTRRTFA